MKDPLLRAPACSTCTIRHSRGRAVPAPDDRQSSTPHAYSSQTRRPPGRLSGPAAGSALLLVRENFTDLRDGRTPIHPSREQSCSEDRWRPTRASKRGSNAPAARGLWWTKASSHPPSPATAMSARPSPASKQEQAATQTQLRELRNRRCRTRLAPPLGNNSSGRQPRCYRRSWCPSDRRRPVSTVRRC